MQDPESDYVFVQTSTRGFTKVSKERYSLISGMILSILEQKSPLTIIELIEEMGEQVKNFNELEQNENSEISNDQLCKRIIV